MYAIIKTGGKQYRVAKGDVVNVELLGDYELGAAVEFKDILFVSKGKEAHVSGEAQSPFLVKGEFLGVALGPKIVSMKYKKRQNQRKKWGHRQKYSQVKITDIANVA